MKMHSIVHIGYEKEGVIKEWALNKGVMLTHSRPYQGDPLPHVDDFDFLLVLGGPQSVLELHKYPYLAQEIHLIQQAIAADKFVLGICLGAQLLGEALGAKAARSPYPERGVYPVMLTQAGLTDRIFKHFPLEFEALHWHEDMAGLPDGAELLAQSAGCPQQAFRYSDKVYGLQFHLELNRTDLIKIIERHPDIPQSPYSQLASDMLTNNIENINSFMQKFLTHFIQLA